jgi:hypothetical protein
VARTNIDEASELTIADVLHKQFEALPADATVELEWRVMHVIREAGAHGAPAGPSALP